MKSVLVEPIPHESDREVGKRPSWHWQPACVYGLFIAAALLIGLYRVSDTGPLWPDSPRYANAAAMIHDWILSGDWSHPYQFAIANYSQYPAFNLPYHPPGYPALLGAFFVLTGVSYTAARVFIALCLGAAGGWFHGILRRQRVTPAVAFGCTLLFLTMPEVVRWSRDTMSEIPALMFILAASYLFLLWLEKPRAWICCLAFALAEMAFLCRVSTAGILPAWFLFALLQGQWRRLLSVPFLVAAGLYFAINCAWVKWVTGFSRYELVDNVYRAGVDHFSWSHWTYYPSHLPDLVGWGTLVLALGAMALALRNFRNESAGRFWLCWLVSYALFQFSQNSLEQRYYVFLIPSLAGVALCWFRPNLPVWLRQGAMLALIVLGIGGNLIQATQLPSGLTGYEAVAVRMKQWPREGNVLLACVDEQELVFRYRAHRPERQRLLLRSDRTLAIRIPDYGVGGPPDVKAHTPEDVIELLRKGRVRYLVTCDVKGPGTDYRKDEMILAHHTAQARPESFVLLDTISVFVDYGGEAPREYVVHLWEFTQPLPDGPCELPIVIPTAGMVIQPKR